MIIASRILQQKRQAVCEKCDFYAVNKLHIAFCKACGCALRSKIACMPCNCPKGKWDSLSGKGSTS